MNGGKDNKASSGREVVVEACPHCGQPLSPWEKILLNVDRMLLCKHCWKKITLVNLPGEDNDTKGEKNS